MQQINSYLKENKEKDKKAKGTKMCVIKENLHLKNIVENKINHLEK